MDRLRHFAQLDHKDSTSEKSKSDHHQESKDKEEISGELHVRLQFVPVSPDNSSAKLIVELIEARNLAAKNKDGTSDPYTIIKIGKKEDRSKTIKKNLSPQWNERFEFKLKASYGSTLQFIVWDWNALTHSEYMGEVNIPLNTLEPNRIIDQWFPLGDTHSVASIQPVDQDNKKQDSQTAFSQFPAKQDPPTPEKSDKIPTKQEPETSIKPEQPQSPTKQDPIVTEQTPIKEQPTKQEQIQQDEIQQDNISTKEQAPVMEQIPESTPPKQESPPKSAEVPTKTEPAKIEPSKTEPIKAEPPKTEPAKIEPSKTEPIKVEQKVEPIKTEPIKAEPANADAIPAQTSLSSVPSQNPLQTPTTPTKSSTDKVTRVDSQTNQQVESSPGTPRSALTGSVGVQNTEKAHHPLLADDPLSSNAALSAALASDDAKDKDYVSGDVHLRVVYLLPTPEKAGGLLIEVVEARNLASKDKSGTSDPYIAFHLGKAEKKTRVIKKNLNPVYNEKLEFEVKYPVANDEELSVVVWDWNAITARTFMGQFSIPLSSLEPNKTYDTFYPLQKKKLVSSTSSLSATPSTNSSAEIPKRILLPETAPAAVATTNIEDIYDSLLINNPQERVRRQLERQYKQQRALAALVYSTFVWKRPVYFGAIYGTSLVLVWLYLWLDLTLISTLCFCAFGALQIWWMSDFIKLDIPWQNFLKDTDPDPTNAFDLMAYCKVTYDDLWVNIARRKERDPAEFIRKVFLSVLIVTFVSAVCNNFIFTFLIVTGVLTAPGVFVNYGDKIKDKIQSITNAKKTN